MYHRLEQLEPRLLLDAGLVGIETVLVPDVASGEPAIYVDLDEGQTGIHQSSSIVTADPSESWVVAETSCLPKVEAGDSGQIDTSQGTGWLLEVTGPTDTDTGTESKTSGATLGPTACVKQTCGTDSDAVGQVEGPDPLVSDQQRVALSSETSPFEIRGSLEEGQGSLSLISTALSPDVLPSGIVAPVESVSSPDVFGLELTKQYDGAEYLQDICVQVSAAQQPVFEFWSPIASRSFYTIDTNERDKLLTEYSHVWTYEGIAYYAFATDAEPSAVPVYRFWSPSSSSHFYTTSKAERDALVDRYQPECWTYEGVAFYAYAKGSQPLGTSPVWRFWSPQLDSHLFTTSQMERDKLRDFYSDVWTYEGICWYADVPQSRCRPSPYHSTRNPKPDSPSYAPVAAPVQVGALSQSHVQRGQEAGMAQVQCSDYGAALVSQKEHFTLVSNAINIQPRLSKLHPLVRDFRGRNDRSLRGIVGMKAAVYRGYLIGGIPRDFAGVFSADV